MWRHRNPRHSEMGVYTMLEPCCCLFLGMMHIDAYRSISVDPMKALWSLEESGTTGSPSEEYVAWIH